MAWQVINNTDIDTNSPLDEDLFDKYRENLRECRQALLPYQYTEQSTSSSSYTTLVTRTIDIPDLTAYTGLQRRVQVKVEARVSANDGDFRLTTSLDNGTAVNVTGTSYAEITLSVNIDSSFAGSTVAINLQARQNTSGTAFTQSVNRIACKVFY